MDDDKDSFQEDDEEVSRRSSMKSKGSRGGRRSKVGKGRSSRASKQIIDDGNQYEEVDRTQNNYDT